jgi:hypothetical protein
VCVVSEALCLVSGGHYTESSNSLVSDEENVRRARAMRVLYLRKVRHAHRMHVLYPRKGRRTHRTCVSLLHNMHKKIPIEYSPRDVPCANAQHAHWHTYANICVTMGILRARHKKHHVEHKVSNIFKALRLMWV